MIKLNKGISLFFISIAPFCLNRNQNRSKHQRCDWLNFLSYQTFCFCSKCANPFIDSYMLLEIDILKGDRVYFSAG